MSRTLALPKLENVPELNFNYEGLRRHSLMCLFISEPMLSDQERKLRGWLLHTLVCAARYYTKARELVALQNSPSKDKSDGTIFYTLDIAEQIENCISATYRAHMAIDRLSKTNTELSMHIEDSRQSFDKLSRIRNQFEHMHSQIVSGETGDGPMSICFYDSGRIIKFRNLSIDTLALHNLIKNIYFIVAEMYPSFDASSSPESGGPIKISISASFQVV